MYYIKLINGDNLAVDPNQESNFASFLDDKRKEQFIIRHPNGTEIRLFRHSISTVTRT